MIQGCVSTVNELAKSEMKGNHDKRRKPIFSLGRRSGRKGDPRMHVAVKAKLADPHVSLFYALKAGGFNYLNDIDPQAVDEEGVTLAQRKNQLSRRLRMAQKADTRQGTTKMVPGTSSMQMFDGLAQRTQATFHHLLRQTTGGSSVASSDSYGIPDQSVNKDEPHQFNDAFSVFPDQPAFTTAARQEGSEPMERSNISDYEQKMPAYSAPHPSERSNETFSDHAQAPPPPILSRLPSRPISDSTTGASLCSEFGLRSLNRTAQSLGLTLDQFALVLSSKANLGQVLGIQNDGEERSH